MATRQAKKLTEAHEQCEEEAQEMALYLREATEEIAGPQQVGNNELGDTLGIPAKGKVFAPYTEGSQEDKALRRMIKGNYNKDPLT